MAGVERQLVWVLVVLLIALLIVISLYLAGVFRPIPYPYHDPRTGSYNPNWFIPEYNYEGFIDEPNLQALSVYDSINSGMVWTRDGWVKQTP